MSYNFNALSKERKFKADTANLGYKSISDLFNQFGESARYKLRAIFINRKNRFGDTPILCIETPEGDSTLVDAPKHLLDTCLSVLHSPEAVEGINNGECDIMLYPYFSKAYNKDCIGVRFCNAE